MPDEASYRHSALDIIAGLNERGYTLDQAAEIVGMTTAEAIRLHRAREEASYDIVEHVPTMALDLVVYGNATLRRLAGGAIERVDPRNIAHLVRTPYDGDAADEFRRRSFNQVAVPERVDPRKSLVEFGDEAAEWPEAPSVLADPDGLLDHEAAPFSGLINPSDY